jgi:hypothetical protein
MVQQIVEQRKYTKDKNINVKGMRKTAVFSKPRYIEYFQDGTINTAKMPATIRFPKKRQAAAGFAGRLS